MQLADVATELYGLALDEFTAARNAAASAVGAVPAADAGADAAAEPAVAGAAEVRGLRKPSASAWVVNMLVRHRSAEIDDVLELGDSLREAQADLDAQQLRALSRQRSQVLAAVAEHGRQVANDLGQTVSGPTLREVEQTLQAAMADPQAAAAVRSGCLVHAITADGLEPADLTDAVAIPAFLGGSQAGSGSQRSAVGSGASSGSDSAGSVGHVSGFRTSDRVPSDSDRKNARRLQEAKRAADEAEQRAKRAVAERESIEAQLEALASERAELDSQLMTLESQRRSLEKAQSELHDSIAALDRRVRTLTRERDKAERAGTDAQSAADRARERWRLLS